MNVGAMIHVVFNYVSAAPWIPAVKMGTGFCIICDVWMILCLGFNLWFSTVMLMIWNAISNGLRENIDVSFNHRPNTRLIKFANYGFGIPFTLTLFILALAIYDTATLSSYYNATLESCTTKPPMKLAFVVYVALCLVFLLISAVVSQYYIIAEPVIRKTCKTLSILAAFLFFIMVMINVTNITVYAAGRFWSTFLLAVLYLCANTMFVRDLALDGKEFSKFFSTHISMIDMETHDMVALEKRASVYAYLIKNGILTHALVESILNAPMNCNYSSELLKSTTVEHLIQRLDNYVIFTEIQRVLESRDIFVVEDKSDEESDDNTRELVSVNNSRTQTKTRALTDSIAEELRRELTITVSDCPGAFVSVSHHALKDFAHDLIVYYQSPTYSGRKQIIIRIIEKYFHLMISSAPTASEEQQVVTADVPRDEMTKTSDQEDGMQSNLHGTQEQSGSPTSQTATAPFFINSSTTTNDENDDFYSLPPVPLPINYIQGSYDLIQALSLDDPELDRIGQFADACLVVFCRLLVGILAKS